MLTEHGSPVTNIFNNTLVDCHLPKHSWLQYAPPPLIGSMVWSTSSWRQSVWLRRINTGALRHEVQARGSIERRTTAASGGAEKKKRRGTASKENTQVCYRLSHQRLPSTTTTMNGQMNGFHNSLIDEDCFLFTSESVGEGHPGKTRHIVPFISVVRGKMAKSKADSATLFIPRVVQFHVQPISN